MIYVALDDFCDEHAAEFEPLLNRCLERYKNFKATLFTIPQRTQEDTLRKWYAKYPCLEFALHGLTHEDGETWFKEYDLTRATILEHFGEATKIGGFSSKLPYYVAGFKAPWWKLGHVAARAFNDLGYWVAVNGTHTVEEEKLTHVYNYKRGCFEMTPDLHYRAGPSHYWHGHVQSQFKYNQVSPNGLGDVIEKFLVTFDPDVEFGFVNNLFNTNPLDDITPRSKA